MSTPQPSDPIPGLEHIEPMREAIRLLVDIQADLVAHLKRADIIDADLDKTWGEVIDIYRLLDGRDELPEHRA